MKTIRNLLLVSLTSTLWMMPSAEAKLDTRFLLGATVGYGLHHGNFTTEMDYINPAVGAGGFYTHIKSLIHDYGFIWGALLGGEMRCDDWLLGLELAYEKKDFVSDINQTFSDSLGFTPVSQGWIGQARYESGDTISLSLRWGYRMTRYLLPYIRVGIETSEDKFSEYYSGVNGYPFTLSNIAEKRLYRAIGGIGVEAPLHKDKFTLRAEYNFHAEGKKLRSKGLIVDNVRDPFFTNVAGADMHTFKASLVWHIG